MEKYSFLASVYKNTKLEEMKICVESMINQTCPPDQIVIVIDGAVPEALSQYISSEAENNPELFTIVPLSENVGLGRALAAGMIECRNEIIARTDTDDINRLDRMSIQLDFMAENDVDIVGSNIAEFIDTPENIVSYRKLPQRHEDICVYLKKRCPFNHMTVVFKKSAVEKAGGYLHWHYNEDSYLWVRMYLSGAKFANIDDNLVYARIDIDTFKRRGGYKYYKSERDLFAFMYKSKIISFFEYQEAKIIRFIVQVLMPNGVRQWFFKNFARSKK